MSNTAVGAVFKKIIDQVIDTSRTDFEENGIDASVLQSLQENWQQRLSASHRASFPWDPQPQQAPAAATQGSTQASTPQQQQNARASGTNAAASAPQAASSSQTYNAQTHIKQEGGYDTPQFLNLPNTYQNNPAMQRAQQQMHAQFGGAASQSINAMHAQNQQRQTPAQQSSGQQAPQIKTERSSTLSNAQTDGAADTASEDWASVVAGSRALPETERIANDGTIRAHIEAAAQRLEAGGLMMPLDERRKTYRKAAAAATSTAGPSATPAGPARFDGGDDSDAKEEDEEDAINSDLDDSDDELAEGIEDLNEGNVILCLFDKVQRVKNKWKTTLKDGVVTVDGKDYVFHKAQGEFEW